MEGLYRGAMRKVRAELGLTSFGVQTIDLPPNSDRHRWHDHKADGQEELYVALRGGGTLEVEGAEPVELAPGETLARVGPSARRRAQRDPSARRGRCAGQGVHCKGLHRARGTGPGRQPVSARVEVPALTLDVQYRLRAPLSTGGGSAGTR
jgi:hypothetical protein